MTFRRVIIADAFEVEIPQFLSSYEFLDIIAEGSYSVICRVRSLTTDNLYACKVVPRKIFSEDVISESFEREVRILQTIRHPNIVQLMEILYAPDIIFIIMEYCSGGDICQAIQKFGCLDAPQCWRSLHDILRALDYLHSHNISHRDIKPDNILLSASGDAKIGDFGLAHQIAGDGLLKTPCGSLSYCAPEVLRGDQYDGRLVDIWSLGVVLYVMCAGRLPWKSANMTDIYNQATNGEFELPGFVSVGLQKVIVKMMRPIPTQRPTIAELLKDPEIAALGLRFTPQGLGISRSTQRLIPRVFDFGKNLPRVMPASMRSKVIIRPNVTAQGNRDDAVGRDQSQAEQGIRRIRSGTSQ
jgi:serine/threonine protein kinase